MKHSKIVPFARLKPKRISIFEISELVIGFYKKLSEYDSNYRKIFIVSETRPQNEFVDAHNDQSINILANEILHQNIKDIIKIDKVENPDISYSRENSILFSLEVKKNDETLMTLHFSFGTKIGSSIGRIVVNEECFLNFLDAKRFLEILAKSFDVLHCSLRISELKFGKLSRVFKVPLGWITYFSNDYELPIPDDLEGIEYEHTDKGKYLILTREEFTSDTEEYEAHKQKLLDVMEEIKRRVPEYGK